MHRQEEAECTQVTFQADIFIMWNTLNEHSVPWFCQITHLLFALSGCKTYPMAGAMPSRGIMPPTRSCNMTKLSFFFLPCSFRETWRGIMKISEIEQHNDLLPCIPKHKTITFWNCHCPSVPLSRHMDTGAYLGKALVCCDSLCPVPLCLFEEAHFTV